MRHSLIYACGLALPIVLGGPHSVRAQTTSVGPYYATPSWDQTVPCTSPSNCPRFVVLANFNSEAVLDRETRLVWERAPSTSTFPWSSGITTGIASYHC